MNYYKNEKGIAISKNTADDNIKLKEEKGVLLIIKPDETIETIAYEDFTSTQFAVDGSFEHVLSLPVELPTGKCDIDLWCNDEGLYRNDFKKVNAFVTALYGFPIYGNVAVTKQVIVDREIDSAGFNYKWNHEEDCLDLCEAWYIEDLLLLNINQNKDNLQKIHKDFDDNKPEPEFIIGDLDEDLGKE